jgi:hypothetical protein
MKCFGARRKARITVLTRLSGSEQLPVPKCIRTLQGYLSHYIYKGFVIQEKLQ